jgi:hypothetical protein
MESRAMMPSEGFSCFADRVVQVIGVSGQRISGNSMAIDWDGRQLQFVPCRIQEQSPVCMQPGRDMIDSSSSAVLDFGNQITVWDPRCRLSEVSMRFLAVSTGIKASMDLVSAGRITSGSASGVSALAEVSLAADIRALLAKAYAAGRRAEGMHGSGVFAAGFKRLQVHPDFPAVAVGFGPGTTPAGDDWLAGCLVALDLRAGGPGKAAALLRQKIRDRLEQTTAAGRALLLGALAGAPPEYLVGLAEAAADGFVVNIAVERASVIVGDLAVEERQTGEQALWLGGLRVAVAKCLEHGATSGEDALAGFVYGLEADLKSMQLCQSVDYEP